MFILAFSAQNSVSRILNSQLDSIPAFEWRKDSMHKLGTTVDNPFRSIAKHVAICYVVDGCTRPCKINVQKPLQCFGSML